MKSGRPVSLKEGIKVLIHELPFRSHRHCRRKQRCYTEPMLVWLLSSVFTGSVLTFSYAAAIYAFSPLPRWCAGLIAVSITVASIVVFFCLLSSGSHGDVGGPVFQFIFAALAVLLGGPIGFVLLKGVIEGIERRGSAD